MALWAADPREAVLENAAGEEGDRILEGAPPEAVATLEALLRRQRVVPVKEPEADPDPSTPPAHPEPSTPIPPAPPELHCEAVWRQTFLAQFTNPADREALQRFGDLLYTVTLSAGYAGDRDRLVAADDLDAVADDLDALAAVLREISEVPDHLVLGRENRGLCREVRDWEGRLTDLAHFVRSNRFAPRTLRSLGLASVDASPLPQGHPEGAHAPPRGWSFGGGRSAPILVLPETA